ncbi:ABC transporter substrate-binding protein [Paractinoplanes lichenicola]|uniref:ABC transporter substrate-binding protein n=1 Tax=Paractinoplanes lichenicola TaxID=2802976 RepID=A0ABS1VR00_9ACTN|nr:ABC transporter substrate-binding protein [Actinoplanes lichenicola]MBL7257023.1 ABC transporter substrate-binding protein [Actinoplanes lichenicola]
MLIAGAAGCTSDDDAASGAEVVVIAADLNNSSVDTAYARALQLRVDQINASGQLGDRELRLVTKDNRNDPAASMRNITSFADDPTVAAVVTGSCDECVVQAAKTINDKTIPTIALASSDVASPVNERQYVFKLGPNSADSTAALVSELSSAGMKTVSVLYTTDLYGRGANTAFNAARGSAITVKATRSVKAGASDIAQTVGTLTDAAPQALVVLTPPDLAQLAARDARAAGYRGRIYMDAAAAGDLFIPREAAAATNNATMVFTQILAIDDVIATTPAKSSRKQWFRDYTSRYGSYSGVASFAADATDLVAGAVARVGTNRVQIREILETSQVDGLSGPIRLTPDNHSGLMPQALTLLVARSGRWRLAS